jgi:microcystin degradation protein MlrC
MTMRVLVAGFQHETNTFAPSKADWAAFEAGAGYPPVTHGAAMLDAMGAGSLPVAGFVHAAHARGWTLLPSIWAGAMPSAHVTRDAFERIAGTIVDDAKRALAAGGLDAVYLDLHGAAVAEHVDDAEGELLQRLRAVVGPAIPVVASLDLHANVSPRMLALASAMTAFREYPHVDMPDTGARAAALLERLARGERWHTHALRLPFLLPLNAQCTLLEPARSVYARLATLEHAHGVALSFAMGFPAADIADCGPVVFGHGADATALHAAVQALHDEVLERRAEFALDLLDADAAVERALTLAGGHDRPVVIADTQDNPGAGGDANTTGLLHALVRHRAGHRTDGRAALGLLWDPDAARAACAAGVGARLRLALGAAVPTFDGAPSDPPLHAEATVVATSDGVVPLHGPMTAGGVARLGPCARLDVDGVQVAVASGKCQMLDLELFRFLGIEPAAMKLLVVKSSVHFRAAFAPVASHILVAKARGPMAADPADLPWTTLPPTIARRP